VSGFRVIEPGVLSLFQDQGRFGNHSQGLTQGGPLDAFAFECANRLVRNAPSATALEISIGKLGIECEVETTLAVTGAVMPLTINGQTKAAWRSHRVRPGDRLTLGHTKKGCRCYLAVTRGFVAKKFFGSTSTVLREGLGRALKAGDIMGCGASKDEGDLALPTKEIPSYGDEVCLRVIPGYQHDLFADDARDVFFGNEYRVTKQCDRMGYRLEGPSVESTRPTLLSEGISLGAIQIPADGQPIILLNDHQTIGGYPKIGFVLSCDLAPLAQCNPGARVRFESKTIGDAQEILGEVKARMESIQFKICE
jgi:biotin-dependent carboxylase-like uncharacterized protein